MGICKKATSVSFDEHTRELVEKARRRYAPMLDESFSAAVRFIIKQHDSLIDTLLSRPDMMLAMIDAQQSLILNKGSQGIFEFPLAAPKRAVTREPSSSPRQGGSLDGFLGGSHREFDALLAQCAGVAN